MKKQYIKPQTIALAIGVTGMVCASGLGFSGQTTDDAGISAADSRSSGYSVWDDDDF